MNRYRSRPPAPARGTMPRPPVHRRRRRAKRRVGAGSVLMRRIQNSTSHGVRHAAWRITKNRRGRALRVCRPQRPRFLASLDHEEAGRV